MYEASEIERAMSQDLRSPSLNFIPLSLRADSSADSSFKRARAFSVKAPIAQDVKELMEKRKFWDKSQLSFSFSKRPLFLSSPPPHPETKK